MKYQWDEEKNKKNIRRHGIDFNDVPSMFLSPMVTFLDSRKDYGEDRWIGIGILKTILALVVFAEPDDSTIRIISARKALKHEQQIYRDQI
jgi:uncharacterized DUF497 family protein